MNYFVAVVVVVACLASVVVVTSAQRPGLPVKSCGGTGQLLNVQISNCNRFPCILRKNTKVTINFDFIPATPSSNVVTGAFGRIANIPLPFIGTNGSPACQKLGSQRSAQNSCPLVAGLPHSYSNTFPILSIYPTTNVDVQWELLDDFDQKIVCFKIPAKIV